MSPFSDVAHLMKGRTIARMVLDAETIARRVRELGQEIGAAYPDGDLLVLGLLVVNPVLKLLGGWQLNGVFTAQTGAPLGLSYSNAGLNAPFINNRPNVN
jgi:hypothetical protein